MNFLFILFTPNIQTKKVEKEMLKSQ